MTDRPATSMLAIAAATRDPAAWLLIQLTTPDPTCRPENAVRRIEDLIREGMKMQRDLTIKRVTELMDQPNGVCVLRTALNRAAEGDVVAPLDDTGITGARS